MHQRIKLLKPVNNPRIKRNSVCTNADFFILTRLNPFYKLIQIKLIAVVIGAFSPSYFDSSGITYSPNLWETSYTKASHPG